MAQASHRSPALLLQRIHRRTIIEFAVSHTIEKALPFVAVIDQYPPGRVARHPHQHPVRTGPAGAGEHGHLDAAVALTGPLPALRGDVDAQFFHRRFSAHGLSQSSLSGGRRTLAWSPAP